MIYAGSDTSLNCDNNERLEHGNPVHTRGAAHSGIFSSTVFRRHLFSKSPGFTLLELILVITIIGVAIAVVFPRFSGFGDTYVKADASRVSALVRYLYQAAATRKVYYRLWFDMEKGAIRVEYSKNGTDYTEEGDSSLRRLKLRDGVDMEDIVVPELGKVNTGEVAVIFSPAGSVEPFTLHLKASEKSLTLYFNPYSGIVKITEGYS